MASQFIKKLKSKFGSASKHTAHDGAATASSKPSGRVASSSTSTELPEPAQIALVSASADSASHDPAAPLASRSASSVQRSASAGPPTSAAETTVPAPTISSPQPASPHSAASGLESLPGRLWNQAYDELKTEEPDLVDAYERILSRRIGGGDLTSPDLDSQTNEIEQTNPEMRRPQMMRLVQAGLDKTVNGAAVKQRIEDGMVAMSSIKSIISTAVQAVPQAAVAWVGVCFALEILANPVTESGVNRRGIAYVVSRTEWYWTLSRLLLDKNRDDRRASEGLRAELEKRIIYLYRKLLSYQMTSVCSYYRNPAVVFLRDLIKLDNWDGSLKDVEHAEGLVRQDSDQYNTQQIKSRLEDLVSAAKSREMKLHDIHAAIQDQTMQQQKMREDEEVKKCLEDLRVTNPRHDKERIEQTKGGLLKDSYGWVLDNTHFQQWRDDGQNRLLWINGDPGKGKTMLLCGIIDELENSQTSPSSDNLTSYFFCQATDSRINNATAVLRGLIYLLIDQQPSLVSHVRKEYDHARGKLFADTNSWVVLSGIFTNILQDPTLKGAYIIIDALDECVTDLPQLLDLIVQKSSMSSHVKWIVSSRNWPNIKERLHTARQRVRLSLELNEASISAAVGIYIRHKVDQLARLKNYNGKTQNAVQDHLSSHASDTFLWVALVCQELAKTPRWETLAKLEAFPPGLDSLYKRMMEQVCNSDGADLYRRILAVLTTVYQPIALQELRCLIERLANVADDVESLEEIVGLCGSFLTIRENTIYFVHQSAKDYLAKDGRSMIFPFPFTPETVHDSIFSLSIHAMSATLRRNIYALPRPGFPIGDVRLPDPDPLAPVRYSCVHWVEHLCEGNVKDRHPERQGGVTDTGPVARFLQEKYVYWLEALSLLKSMSQGVLSIRKLEAFLDNLLREQSSKHPLLELVRDARRFILHSRKAIESAPLQVYASALIFSPTASLLRKLFKKEEPGWIVAKPIIEHTWSSCLQTLEGHGGPVSSVAFSPDSALIASVSKDQTVKIWDTATGGEVRTLKGHDGLVSLVAFSPDSALIASASVDETVKIWDAATGGEVRTLKCGDPVWSVAFSPDSALIASASVFGTVKIWDAATGAEVYTLEGHDRVETVSFDPTGSCLRTNIGPIELEGCVKLPAVAAAHPGGQLPAPRCGCGLSSNLDWITWDGQSVLWLPHDYRPFQASSSAVSSSTVTVGCLSGRVLVFAFSTAALSDTVPTLKHK